MRPPTLARLAWVELRKLADTRSGAALLAGTALVTLAPIGLAAGFADEQDRSLRDLVSLSFLALGTLLPIVAILGWTSEFSQRTALWTFVAVPRRGRVAAAKLLAVLALGLAATALTLAAAVIAVVVSGGDGSLDAGDVAQVLLLNELSVVTGYGFGLVFAAPAPAIVAFFALPSAFAIAGEVVRPLRHVRKWIDANYAWEPLYDMAAKAGDWPEIVTASAVWVALPVLIGLALLARRDIA